MAKAFAHDKKLRSWVCSVHYFWKLVAIKAVHRLLRFMHHCRWLFTANLWKF